MQIHQALQAFIAEIDTGANVRIPREQCLRLSGQATLLAAAVASDEQPIAPEVMELFRTDDLRRIALTGFLLVVASNIPK